MNKEQNFQERQANMNDEELIKRCVEELSEMAKTGGRSFTMSIPPMITDTDMLFGELIKRYNLLRNQDSKP